jgi:tape measure domain-containing protein
VVDVVDVALDGLEGGIKRLDTLERFPRVLQSIGFSAEDASKTSKALFDYVQTLPTPLTEALSSVQRLAGATNDLDRSTTIYKAMNNALLSGGSEMQRQSEAMTQWLEAVSRGRFEAKEFNALLTNMSGVMHVAAKDLLGPTAGTEDLRAALSSGKISMEEFLDEIIKLNKEGSGSFKPLEEQVGAAVSGIDTSFTLVSQSVEIAWMKILDAIGSDNIQNALKGVHDFIGDIGNALVGLVNWAKENKDWFLPFSAVVLGGVVGGVVSLVIANWGKIQPIFQSIWEWIEIKILPAVQGAMAWISSNVAPIVDDIFSHLQSIFTNIVAMIKVLWDNIVTVVQAIMPIVQPVLAILVGAVNDTITAVLVAIDIAIAIIDTAMSAAVWTWKNIISPIVGFISGIINAIVSLFAWWAGQVMIPLDRVRSAFINVFNNVKAIVSAVVSSVAAIITSIPGRVTGKINEIKDRFVAVFDSIRQKVEEIVNGIISTITSIPSRIGDIGGQIGGQISSGVNGAIEGVKGAISGLLSNIPGLATGGYVHATPGGTLAVIGEGGEDEFVIPRSQMIDILTGVANRPLPELKAENMRVDGGGVAIYNTFQINNELDADDIGRRINNSIRLATS